MRWKFFTGLALVMAIKYMYAVGQDGQEAESGPAEAMAEFEQSMNVGSTNWGQGAESGPAEAMAEYERSMDVGSQHGKRSGDTKQDSSSESARQKFNTLVRSTKSFAMPRQKDCEQGQHYPCDKKSGNNYGCSTAYKGTELHQYYYCWRSCDKKGTDECIKHSQNHDWCWARGKHLNGSCSNQIDCQWAAAALCQPFPSV